MRIMRRLLLIVLLVGGFWFVTTHLPQGWNPFHLTGSHAANSTLDLTEAQAAPESVSYTHLGSTP